MRDCYLVRLLVPLCCWLVASCGGQGDDEMTLRKSPSGSNEILVLDRNYPPVGPVSIVAGAAGTFQGTGISFNVDSGASYRGRLLLSAHVAGGSTGDLSQFKFVWDSTGPAPQDLWPQGAGYVGFPNVGPTNFTMQFDFEFVVPESDDGGIRVVRLLANNLSAADDLLIDQESCRLALWKRQGPFE